jgi:DNA-binding XRE family transcriptional regulator
MNAEELVAWRNQAGVTQHDLAALLAVHPMTISRWERGSFAIPPYLKLALNWIKQNSAPDKASTESAAQKSNRRSLEVLKGGN